MAIEMRRKECKREYEKSKKAAQREKFKNKNYVGHVNETVNQIEVETVATCIPVNRCNVYLDD